MLRLMQLATLVFLLTHCAHHSAVPHAKRCALNLAPAALQQTVSVQQHLHVERDNETYELDAALEVDADHLELVIMALGQRAITLQYDGKHLTSWRHAYVPQQIQDEDILNDIQLVFWPREAIAQALPQGWHVEDVPLQRTLFDEQTPAIVIRYSDAFPWQGMTELKHLRYHYKLVIQSSVNAS